ncbi:hypothetical protein [Adhaeretor mobilis]|uniref:Secreted protein n=1 Tax=Adhaeretor mobilis TaxID=1930276 RepID=A0A517MZ47_9BACT|nr:hypothetical protein [Adhaeretor mobilis]QDT00159.1 hypothetical protein HG15A2_34940 [Adhaeretor mobilis]
MLSIRQRRSALLPALVAALVMVFPLQLLATCSCVGCCGNAVAEASCPVEASACPHCAAADKSNAACCTDPEAPCQCSVQEFEFQEATLESLPVLDEQQVSNLVASVATTAEILELSDRHAIDLLTASAWPLPPVRLHSLFSVWLN